MKKRKNHLVTFSLFLFAILLIYPMVPEEKQTRITFKAKVFKNNSFVEKTIKLNSEKTIFYTDAWRSHWCPYYNDRERFLTPRINEFEHLLRSRGFRVMHLNWKGDESNNDKSMRNYFRKIAENGMTDLIKELYPDPMKEAQNYNPDFADECIYKGYTRFGPTRNQRPNYALSLGENDIIAQNFKSVAAECLAMNIKTVVLLGMHTNLCIYNAAKLLSSSGISLGFVTDLLDAGYFYPKQRRTVPTHTEQNEICNGYIGKKFGWQAMSYDIYESLLSIPPTTKEPKWILFPNTARSFRHFYLN